MTLDRMIELLQIEHECMLRGAHGDCDRDCEKCDLVQDDDELHEMYTDVIALLKEQEARVMTLEEVKAFDWDYCYLEEERLPGKEYRMVYGDYALTCITWPCIASMRIQHGDENYGRKWRCWTVGRFPSFAVKSSIYVDFASYRTLKALECVEEKRETDTWADGELRIDQ